MNKNLTNKQTGKVTGITFETILTASARRGSQNIILNDAEGKEIQIFNLYAIEKTSNSSFIGNINNTTTVSIDFINRTSPTFTIFIAETVKSELEIQNTDGRV